MRIRGKITSLISVTLVLILVFALFPLNNEIQAADNSNLSNPACCSDGRVVWDLVEFGSYYQNSSLEKEPMQWRGLNIAIKTIRYCCWKMTSRMSV